MKNEQQNDLLQRVMAMLPDDGLLKLNAKYKCFTGDSEDYKRGSIEGFERGARYVINKIKHEISNLP